MSVHLDLARRTVELIGTAPTSGRPKRCRAVAAGRLHFSVADDCISTGDQQSRSSGGPVDLPWISRGSPWPERRASAGHASAIRRRCTAATDCATSDPQQAHQSSMVVTARGVRPRGESSTRSCPSRLVIVPVQTADGRTPWAAYRAERCGQGGRRGGHEIRRSSWHPLPRRRRSGALEGPTPESNEASCQAHGGENLAARPSL